MKNKKLKGILYTEELNELKGGLSSIENKNTSSGCSCLYDDTPNKTTNTNTMNDCYCYCT